MTARDPAPRPSGRLALPTHDIHRGRFGESLRLTVKRRLLEWLTRDAPPLFLRAGDRISFAPLSGGEHEPQVGALLDRLAQAGYDGFLIDIGANIGLTSCRSADRFRHAFLFEPNPDAFRILQVNTAIALSRTALTLHEFGLAAERRTVALDVPRDNWGGAFVREGNAYGDDTLAAKEGRADLDRGECLRRTVRLEPAQEVLGGIFERMRAAGLRAGVIKLDVEGFELEVLRAMAPAVPADFTLAIVFESWDDAIDPAAVTAPFGARAVLHRLQADPPLDAPLASRALSMLLRGGRRFSLAPARTGALRGDLVLAVEAVVEG